MRLNTGDVVIVTAVIEKWLDEHRAHSVHVSESTLGNGAFPREKRITFRSGMTAGTITTDALKFISGGQVSIRTDDGQSTSVDGDFDTKKSAIYGAIWPLGGAWVLAWNRYFVWAAICVLIVFPVLSWLFAEASVGSLQTGLGKAINRRMSDMPGPRGFTVLPAKDVASVRDGNTADV